MMYARLLPLLVAAGSTASIAFAQDADRVHKGAPARVVPLMPTEIIYKGRHYPVHQSAADVTQYVYANGVDTTLPVTGFLRSTAVPKRIFDRLSFFGGPGQGSGQLLTSVQTVHWTMTTITAPAQNVEVEIEVFDTITPTVAPINTVSDGVFRLVFAPPGGAWAANTVYRMPAPASLAGLPGGGIQTLDGDIGVDIRCYIPGGTGNTGLNPDTGPALWDGGAGTVTRPQTGFSDANYYRDTNANGQYDATGEAFTFANRLANAAIGFEADPVATVSCCLPDGTCKELPPAGCAKWSGVAGAAGSSCAGVTCTQPAGVLVNNGYTGSLPIPAQPVLVTGATAGNNHPAPVGAVYSELQGESTTCSANTLGSNDSGTFRIADNFTLSSAATVNQVVVFPIITNSEAFGTNFTSATLQIWDGRPGDAGSSVVFGDTTTNVLASAMFSGAFRIGNTVAVAPAVTGTVNTTSPIFRIALNVNATLPAGNYWLDWNVTGATANFSVPVTVVGARTIAGANGRQFVAATPIWQDLIDAGSPANCGTGPQPLDEAFLILGSAGSGSTCYANCDSSTQVPFLNVQDFTCFLGKFSSGNSYANCDNSTQAPVLNVQDFTCFLQKFSAGCSAP